MNQINGVNSSSYASVGQPSLKERCTSQARGICAPWQSASVFRSGNTGKTLGIGDISARREERYRMIPGAVAVFAVLAASFALATLDETEPFSAEVGWPLLVLGTLDAQSVPQISAVAGWPNPAFAASGVEIAPVATIQNGDGFELAGPWGIAVYESDNRLYAIVVERIGDAIQIIDITDPASPAAVATVRNGDGFELDDPTVVAVYEDGSRSYAILTAHNSNLIQIIDITDPASPAAVATVRNGDGIELEGALGFAVHEDGDSSYAVVAAHFGHAIQIIDITDPASPAAVATVRNGNGFELDGPGDVAVYESGGRSYAVVAVFDGDVIQIIDITDPASPAAVATVRNGEDLELDGPWGIAVYEDDERSYAIVAVRSDSLLQIIDITDPASPAAVATVRNGEELELDGPWGIAVYEDDERSYVIVGALNSGTVQIIDITDPASPAVVATVRNGEDFGLAGPTGIAVYESGGSSYAAVSAFQGNTVQIVRIDARILPTVGANLEPDGKEGSGMTGSTPQDSPATEPPNAGGCLIATAAYGTETAPQVQALREVRDNVVLDTAAGSAFMQGFNQIYYSFSPAIADMQRQNDAFNAIVRALVMPMLATLSIMSLADGSSEIGVVGLGLSVLVLNMGLYVGSPTFAGFLIHRYRKHRSDAHPDNQKCTN